jgi:hypothetical protein
MQESKIEYPAPDRDEKSGRFLTGNNGGGRRKGSRNKLSEDFITDLYATWQQHGEAALAKTATGDPVAFCKLVANLLPAKFESTMSISLTADFEAARNFNEAWKVIRQARELIGSELPVIDVDVEPERRDCEFNDD